MKRTVYEWTRLTNHSNVAPVRFLFIYLWLFVFETQAAFSCIVTNKTSAERGRESKRDHFKEFDVVIYPLTNSFTWKCLQIPVLDSVIHGATIMCWFGLSVSMPFPFRNHYIQCEIPKYIGYFISFFFSRKISLENDHVASHVDYIILVSIRFYLIPKTLAFIYLLTRKAFLFLLTNGNSFTFLQQLYLQLILFRNFH